MLSAILSDRFCSAPSLQMRKLKPASRGITCPRHPDGKPHNSYPHTVYVFPRGSPASWQQGLGLSYSASSAPGTVELCKSLVNDWMSEYMHACMLPIAMSLQRKLFLLAAEEQGRDTAATTPGQPVRPVPASAQHVSENCVLSTLEPITTQARSPALGLSGKSMFFSKAPYFHLKPSC